VKALGSGMPQNSDTGKKCLRLIFVILLSVLFHRLKRDITERERDLVGVLQQYNTFVKPVSFYRLSQVCITCLSVEHILYTWGN